MISRFFVLDRQRCSYEQQLALFVSFVSFRFDDKNFGLKCTQWHFFQDFVEFEIILKISKFSNVHWHFGFASIKMKANILSTFNFFFLENLIAEILTTQF